jgi:TolB-like protein
MRKAFIFRSLCMVMTWVYCTVAAQAGQVITQKERTWAKKSMSVAESEKNLAPVSASNTVAVLYFNNKTGLEDLNALQKGMAIMLITDLAKVGKLQVVERIRMQALLDEMNLGASGLVDPATAPKVGKMLGAYYLSTGDIAIGKMAELNITPVLIDVPFETVTPQTAAAGNLQDMFRMEKEILFSIIKQMKIFLTAKEREELNKPLAASSVAALAFFAGVDLSDKGRYAEAAKMYDKAVLEDKNFSMAKDALQELKTLGLTSSGEAVITSSPAAKEAVEGGSSTGNIGLITLGAVVVGGGVALALSGGGGSSSSTTTTTTDTKGPVIVASDPVDKGKLPSCSSGTLHYISNEVLKAKSCAALISSNSTTYGWGAGDVTVDNTKLDVTYSMMNPSTCEQPALTMTVTISGCQDTEGNTMTEKDFTYYYTYP